MTFKIGGVDFSNYVAGLKVDYETLVSNNSGRNAKGTMHIDILSHKYKVTVQFIPLTANQAYSLGRAIMGNNYVSNITFTNPYTMTDVTINTYTSTPSFEWYRYSNGLKLTKPISISFIEL